jgi:hypothetical protein
VARHRKKLDPIRQTLGNVKGRDLGSAQHS